MIRIIVSILLALTLSTSAFASSEWSRTELLFAQKELNALGYNAGSPDGIWGKKTESALRNFYANESVKVNGFAEFKKALSGAAKNYPKLPSDYFAGFGSKWYLNIHNWGSGSSGKRRYFEPKNSDLSTYKKAGASVMRLQLQVEAALFWRECNWRSEANYETHNNCYDREFKKAADDKWLQKLDEINSDNNPVIKTYVSAAKKLQKSGFHLIIVPQDFFWGNGGNWLVNSDIPLLHAYLERDENFRITFNAFNQRLVRELVKNGVTQFSFQTLNEPRFCKDRLETRKWEKIERSIILSVREISPNLEIISSAICTASDRELSNERRYNTLKRMLPRHKDIDNLVYALHLRNPRLLHIADHASLQKNTTLAYPYSKLDPSVGLNKNTQKQIQVYNKNKPDYAFYDQIFKDIAATSKSLKRRIIITEWSISKPDYGLPASNRRALASDILTASKKYGIPIIYNGLLGRDGLSNRDNLSTPYHDFDTELLQLFKQANKSP